MAEEAAASSVLPDDFYYDAKQFAREPPAIELPSSFAPLYHSFAFESHKRTNLHYLDEVRPPASPFFFCLGVRPLLARARVLRPPLALS